MVSILSNLFLTFSYLLSGASSPVAQIEAYNPSVNIQIGTFEVEYDVIPELVKGKKFFLCMAAYTYKISCEQWQIDDWWWGNYEVDGSRSSFTTYYTVDPFITIGFEDGSIIK